jgi:tRNA nucleotidyltransferase (CCA-adding enzyme)
LLHGAGYEAYVVGGCVRDAIMGNEINDFDITTSATPEEMKVVFKDERTFDTGIKHGTITLYYNHENVEITTYRIEGEYEDNRHPKSVEFTRSLENDLKRRDFTMNAIVYNDNEGYVDIFSGRQDIENKTIRAIGDPKKRFEEDALRILRAIRFSSCLGFRIEEKTRQAMIECKSLLHNISGERIAVEINKLLLGKNVKNVILENYEILGEIIPEIKQMKGFDQRTKWHIYDILTHTAVVVENIPPIPHLRLAALLHDTGKVHTFTVDENGSGHFYGHNEKSGEIAHDYLVKYRYDNFTRDRVTKLVKIHDTPIEEDRILIKKRINRMGEECFFDLIELKIADNKAQNPMYTKLDHFEMVKKIANEILNESCFSLKSLAINGSDLIKDGHKPGKNLGAILDIILNEVMEEKLPNEREKLLERAREIAKEIDK